MMEDGIQLLLLLYGGTVVIISMRTSNDYLETVQVMNWIPLAPHPVCAKGLRLVV